MAFHGLASSGIFDLSFLLLVLPLNSLIHPDHDLLDLSGGLLVDKLELSVLLVHLLAHLLLNPGFFLTVIFDLLGANLLPLDLLRSLFLDLLILLVLVSVVILLLDGVGLGFLSFLNLLLSQSLCFGS